MAKSKSVMENHNKAYENSGLSIRKYCLSVGIKPGSLQYYRQETAKLQRESDDIVSQKLFREYDVGITFKILITDDGLVNLYGINPSHLVNIIRACRVLSK